MKVFISWSGDMSKQVAEALRDWVGKVIQSLEPWMSDKDIDKGARWSEEIKAQLDSSEFGIICVTPDNRDAPWLNFEAGALSKYPADRVCPYLWNLKSTDIKGPLPQFQMAEADEDGTRKLMKSLNKAAREKGITEQALNEQLEHYWPELQGKLDKITSPQPSTKPTRKDRELLEEILDTVRHLDRATARTQLESPDVPSWARRYVSDQFLTTSGAAISPPSTEPPPEWFIQLTKNALDHAADAEETQKFVARQKKIRGALQDALKESTSDEDLKKKIQKILTESTSGE